LLEVKTTVVEEVATTLMGTKVEETVKEVESNQDVEEVTQVKEVMEINEVEQIEEVKEAVVGEQEKVEEATATEVTQLRDEAEGPVIEDESKWIDGKTDLYVKVYDSFLFVQTASHHGQEPPETWDNEKKYEGQAGKGNKAVELLKTILEETKKEATECHSGENDSQKAYEDGMKELKDEEADLQDSLANLKESIDCTLALWVH